MTLMTFLRCFKTQWEIFFLFITFRLRKHWKVDIPDFREHAELFSLFFFFFLADGRG